MNRIAACLLGLVLPAAWAETAPGPSGLPVSPEIIEKATCSGCGEIRSLRRIETPLRPAPRATERKDPSGFVASIPLGNAGGKPYVGSSTREERRREGAGVTYEIVVELDDGGLTVVLQNEANDLKQGDKVRVEDGKVRLK
ncbi:MAG TPA: hypothetical protein VN878_09770 [Usitatibacter sp.]|nr:hypothetical protein [Usitatibacter sp.]